MKKVLAVLAVAAMATLSGCFTPVGLHSYQDKHALQIAVEQSPAGPVSFKAAIDLLHVAGFSDWFKAEPVAASASVAADLGIAAAAVYGVTEGIKGLQGSSSSSDSSTHSSTATTDNSKSTDVNVGGNGNTVTIKIDSGDVSGK